MDLERGKFGSHLCYPFLLNQQRNTERAELILEKTKQNKTKQNPTRYFHSKVFLNYSHFL